jgi:hypothetical protein
MVVTIQSNALQVASNLGKISAELPKATNLALRELSLIGKRIAQNLAPQKSGALKRGITRKVFKNKAEVTSRVFKSFPYHFWVNQNISTLDFRDFNRFFSVPQRVAYGKPAINPSGRPIIWTGFAGYMTKTAELLNKITPQRFSAEIEKVLVKNQTR